jgi:hypothetical protein
MSGMHGSSFPTPEWSLALYAAALYLLRTSTSWSRSWTDINLLRDYRPPTNYYDHQSIKRMIYNRSPRPPPADYRDAEKIKMRSRSSLQLSDSEDQSKSPAVENSRNLAHGNNDFGHLSSEDLNSITHKEEQPSESILASSLLCQTACDDFTMMDYALVLVALQHPQIQRASKKVRA